MSKSIAEIKKKRGDKIAKPKKRKGK